jgi:threonine/homoserine/homoserine lactone efflux protein
MRPETAYRWVRPLFPAGWRAAHEDELLATLAEAVDADTGPAGGRATPADVADLARAGLALRARALRRSGATSPAVLVGAAVVACVAAAAGARAWVDAGPADFLVTSVVVALVPGTGVVYTVSSALGGGWRRGLLATIGCTLGIVPHVAAAMLGLSGIMQAGAVAFEAVRWAGVAYLLVMGVGMIRDRGNLRLDGDAAATEGPAAAIVRRGVLLNLLNPKLTVFFFAFLPQFLDSPPGLLDGRLAGLGAVFMLVTFAVFAGYAWASAAVRERVLGRPRVLRSVQRAMGTLLVGFAARLAVSDR